MTFKEAVTGMIPCMAEVNVREQLEIAVVDQRKGIYKIGKMHGDYFIWMGLPYDKLDDKKVFDWTHTAKTMLIVL